jgi:hypothetical protein
MKAQRWAGLVVLTASALVIARAAERLLVAVFHLRWGCP